MNRRSVLRAFVGVLGIATLFGRAFSGDLGDVAGLQLDGGDDTVLTWNAVPSATGYDVLASALPTFDRTQVFVQVGAAASSAGDPFTPGEGEVRHYLVRAVDDVGFGPWGFASDDAERAFLLQSRIFIGPSRIASTHCPIAITTDLMDGDEHLDLVVLTYYDSSVGVLVGDGSGGFTPSGSTSTVESPYTLATGDLDGSGTADVVVTRPVLNAVKVHFSDPSGDLSAGVDLADSVDQLFDRPGAVGIDDVDGDTALDIVVPVSGTFPHVGAWVVLGDGAGGFGTPVSAMLGLRIGNAVALGNVNACCDPYLDLIYLMDTSDVAVALGDGMGPFSLDYEWVGAGESSLFMAVHDLNDDLNDDIVLVNSAFDDLSVLLADGTGGFSESTRYAAGDFPSTVSIGDLDGDTIPDLVTANSFGNSVSVLLGDGTGTFSAPVDYATGDGPAQATTGDFNGDGALDVAVADCLGNTVSIWLGIPAESP